VGGNDIFSSLAYIKCQLYQYEKIGLIGVLGFTPFHTNDPMNKTEQPLIKPTSQMKRYLLGNPIKEISCYERLLPEIINYLQLNIKYMCMSSKYLISLIKS